MGGLINKVLIVGGGNAACSAAHAALEKTQSVAIIEKAPLRDRGGNSAMTGHIRFTAWDADHPATQSPFVVAEIIRKRIVLEGDIPSAMNPPPGCPFQTRCRWKSQVPGGLCDREVPPVRMLEGGHQIKCHLPDKVLATMEPVIQIAAE